MSDRPTPPRPPPLSFHPGADIHFRLALLDAYNAIPHPVRLRLQAYAGAPTVIRTVHQPFPVNGNDVSWTGLNVSPRSQGLHPGSLPLESRALTRLGRHQLVIAEHDKDGTPLPPLAAAVILHHEIGHRIDDAISGNNYIDSPTRRSFSQSGAFIDAMLSDLYDAGWRPNQPPPPGFRVFPYLLPQPDASGSLNWLAAASELFAHLYARRFSTALDDQSRLPERQHTDFSIFRRTGRLVDRAVATFAHPQPVTPLNANPGDYGPGELPTPLLGPTDTERLNADLLLFEPVRHDESHPPRPRPSGPVP